jgi:hypothetical protein
VFGFWERFFSSAASILNAPSVAGREILFGSAEMRGRGFFAKRAGDDH